FDPVAMTNDYAEANAWQSLWMPGLHDSDGLRELLGGPNSAVAKLEAFFDQAAADLKMSGSAGLALPRPYYWHGNEPDLVAAYLFAMWGRPDLTDRWVAWILRSLYADTPDGLAGNDDAGTLSAWYVWAALGLYPIAGSDRYILGRPLFPHVTVE